MNIIDEFKNRYSFLYENAPLILACFANGFSLSGHVLCTDYYFELRNKVKKQMGFKEIYRCYNLGESHDFIYLIEDAFLGDKKIEETELYRIINKIKSKKYDSVFSSLKREYNFDEADLRSSIHKYDKAFRILLECILVFVNSQKHHLTRVESDKDVLYFYRKFSVMQRYFGVQRYRVSNLGFDCDELDEFGLNFNLDKVPNMSLVKESDFLFTLAHYRLYGISDDVLSNMDRELYFKYHDIIPSDNKVECNTDSFIERPDNSFPCSNKFSISEDDVFYYENGFFTLCPCCRYIVKVDNDFIPSKISERIKDKALIDKDMYRKSYLLSELSFLDSDGKILSKIKK